MVNRDAVIASGRRWSLLLVAVTLFSVLLWPRAVTAEQPTPELFRINEALAEGRPIRVAVVGDSLARGLWRGLYRAFRHTNTVQVRRHAKSATGLVRTDRYDWFAAAQRLVGQDNPDVIVVLIGGNDRQDFRTRSGRLERMSGPWRHTYSERAARFANLLRANRAAVYWVGLPVVRSRRMERDYSVFNAIFTRVSAANRIRYLDTFRRFRDDAGRYSAFGPGPNGRTQKLRDDDGLHFTLAGNRMLAEEVGSVLRDDIQRTRRRQEEKEHEQRAIDVLALLRRL